MILASVEQLGIGADLYNIKWNIKEPLNVGQSDVHLFCSQTFYEYMYNTGQFSFDSHSYVCTDLDLKS